MQAQPLVPAPASRGSEPGQQPSALPLPRGLKEQGSVFPRLHWVPGRGARGWGYPRRQRLASGAQSFPRARPAGGKTQEAEGELPACSPLQRPGLGQTRGRAVLTVLA